MTDTLFEQHTIKEIQEIEKKLRNDIEKKKEELRQMVGERYRDLMEAADTITEMKEITENIHMRIQSVEGQFMHLQSSDFQSSILQSVKLKVEERKKKNQNVYTVAGLIKILMDSPAKIWTYIENEDFLSALQVFLLARHTHSVLAVDPVYTKQGVLSTFPIINKQWTSTRHFQYTLLQKSEDRLTLEKVEAENIVGPLCCMVFLSDASFNHVFDKILSTRKVAVLNIFKPEKSAKSQICELVASIQNALSTIHTLFYPNTENFEGKTNLLLQTVHQIISQNNSGPVSLLDLQTSPIAQYFPKDISAYRPVLKTYQGVTLKHLQSSCKDWVQSLKSELKQILEDLLDYVATIKGLAMIREAVVGQLSEVSSWDVICDHTLNENFSIWDFFLKDCFMKRINTIINNKVEVAKNTCTKEIDKVFVEFQSKRLKYEENVSSYIWIESESDLAVNLGWVPHHQKHLWDSGTLGMKSYGLTPKIQNICSMIDKKLENLLDDIGHFTAKKSKQDDYTLEKTNIFSRNSFPDLFVDCQVIYSHLTNVTKKCFFDLTSHLRTMMQSFDVVKEDKIFDTSFKITFLGHLCSGLTKLCPHLLKCLLLENNEKLSTSSIALFTSAAKDDRLWQSLKSGLLDLSNEAFRLWGSVNIKIWVEKFDSELVVCSGSGILKALLLWDKIEIQEESEEGTSLKSVLRIPQQISVPLYSCLFKFCNELIKIGGHSLSSQLRSEFREQYLLQLINVYKKKSHEKWPEDIFCSHLAQTQSLQLLFDVQFLMGFLSSKENSNKKINDPAKETIEKLISYIDPFDMDVFASYLQTNLKKGMQKSMLLLGLVASPEQVSHLNNMKTSPPSGQIDHNLMLMPSACSRLPLLPFATRSNPSVAIPLSESASKITLTPQASPLKSARSHSSSPNLNVSDNLANVLKSSSFYDRVTAMSSSWFGGS